MELTGKETSRILITLILTHTPNRPGLPLVVQQLQMSNRRKWFNGAKWNSVEYSIHVCVGGGSQTIHIGSKYGSINSRTSVSCQTLTALTAEDGLRGQHVLFLIDLHNMNCSRMKPQFQVTLSALTCYPSYSH